MQVERRVEHVTGRRVSIELPDSFDGQDVEILIRTLDRPRTTATTATRRPHPDIAGRVPIRGDILSTAPEADWNLPA